MIVGLTGGIGCGKSVATAFFAELGWSTVDTDRIARDLLETDSTVIDAISARWSTNGVSKDGALDRAAIASIVFADVAELRWLESLLHPRIHTIWTEKVAAAPGKDWLVEIPLLFEKSLEKSFDATVCLAAAPETILKRMAHRGYTPEQVRARAVRQIALSDKIERADFVLSNDGSLPFLQAQARRLSHALTRAKFLKSPLNHLN